MQQKSEKYYLLHRLMTSKLAGSISSEEDSYLNQEMEESEEARELWKQISDLFDRDDIENNFNRHDTRQWVDPKDLLTHSRRHRIKKTILIASLAAATLAGIFFVTYFLFKQPDLPPQMAARQENTVKLKLANGTIIDFSQNRDSIKAGNAVLSNINKSLTYNTEEASGSINSLIIPNGMNYHVVLSDGTEVWLNSATTLKFPFNFTGPTREVTISGEAYLRIAKNAKKPFIVHIASQSAGENGSPAFPSVQVLGTEFNVNSYNSNAIKVALVEGSVKLKAPGIEVAIKPGTEAQYEKEKGISMLQFDEDEVLGWREGRYYMYEAKLKDLSTELVRLYDIKVVIDDPSIAERKFTGVLNRNKPVTHFLEYLRETLEIKYSFDKDGTLHLTSKSK